MKLQQYIKGVRSGAVARDIEMEAMKDGFLSDALDGYTACSGDHMKDVADLEKEIVSSSFQRSRVWIFVAVAVAIVVIAAGVLYCSGKDRSVASNTAQEKFVEGPNIAGIRL